MWQLSCAVPFVPLDLWFLSRQHDNYLFFNYLFFKFPYFIQFSGLYL